MPVSRSSTANKAVPAFAETIHRQHAFLLCGPAPYHLAPVGTQSKIGVSPVQSLQRDCKEVKSVRGENIRNPSLS